MDIIPYDKKPWVADFFFVQFYKYPGIIEGILLLIKGEDLVLSFEKVLGKDRFLQEDAFWLPFLNPVFPNQKG